MTLFEGHFVYHLRIGTYEITILFTCFNHLATPKYDKVFRNKFSFMYDPRKLVPSWNQTNNFKKFEQNNETIIPHNLHQ